MIDLKPMQIKPGVIYNNLTFRYLAHYFSNMCKDFNSYFASSFKLGFGINDYQLSNYQDYNQHLFVLIDIYGMYNGEKYTHKKQFIDHHKKLIDKIDTLDSFVKKYNYDNVEDSHLVMFIFDLKDRSIIDNFIMGSFSRMFNPNIFDKRSLQYSVMVKDEKFGNMYLKGLNKEYNTNLILSDLTEYDKMPLLSQEIFNYNEHNKKHTS